MLRNGLEPWHLLVVAIVFVVLFGSKKLPDMARSLGKSARILKSEAAAMKSDGGPTAGPDGGPAVRPGGGEVAGAAGAAPDGDR
ncbi:Sec-independent protein translocase subunit TatA [Streptomyces mayonensis]|uniref:Sec-independent protein translocase subunit TatA n=1 Tax=Streptomyces mayonensis TaxID=2750816 RepID=UPI001C1DFBE8|nr:Sec-independent protein translocase subunit TatA [Streptomyces sp. A108]MBU6534905.1 Sec-independent protein translocase subunit TatA [Streptomyces sp. A108]